MMEQLQNWRARRWLRRHDAKLADTPTWRLMQELRQRGALRDAPLTEAPFSKGERLGSNDGIVVDTYGIPLLQQRFDGEDWR